MTSLKGSSVWPLAFESSLTFVSEFSSAAASPIAPSVPRSRSTDLGSANLPQRYFSRPSLVLVEIFTSEMERQRENTSRRSQDAGIILSKRSARSANSLAEESYRVTY